MSKIFLKWISFSFGIFLFFFVVSGAEARENVTDWYVKDFNSRITVNEDSSLDITETILADCGSCVGKHGIFRILPEKINIIGKGTIQTPVKLLSIKDQNGIDYGYAQIKNSADKTVTWKIGEANKTIQGENIYVIKYRVKNAIRFYNDNFDEFYWNLTGNFWDLEIDKAHIEVIFPKEIKNDEVTTSLYTGTMGEKENNGAEFYWGNDANLVVDSTEILRIGEGITVAVTFTKGIFIPYVPTFWEVYGKYLFFIIPILVFIICFNIWRKYGDDPEFGKTVIAQYAPPKDMSPTEMGVLMTNGKFKNHFITAEIINLATNKILTIKETENNVLFFKLKEYQFERSNNIEAENKLDKSQKIILDKIFAKGNTIKLSSLKNDFYKVISDIRKEARTSLDNKKLIVKAGLTFKTIFIPLGVVALVMGISIIQEISMFLGGSIIISGIVMIIFGIIMPKRTLEGAEKNWEIKGFKLFMKTVDKDRAKFYEEENIFEKFLPYAILFEITDIWISRIKEIYGEEYFSTHIPAWYIGSNLSSFDINSFNSTLNDLSSNIAASTSAPSGSGGGGSSGGGGGGGGGGGW